MFDFEGCRRERHKTSELVVVWTVQYARDDSRSRLGKILHAKVERPVVLNRDHVSFLGKVVM